MSRSIRSKPYQWPYLHSLVVDSTILCHFPFHKHFMLMKSKKHVSPDGPMIGNVREGFLLRDGSLNRIRCKNERSVPIQRHKLLWNPGRRPSVTRTASLFLLAGLFVLGTVTESPAIDLGLGILKRWKKTDPPDEVEVLSTTLQSDPDDKKRLAAAEELGKLDPRTNGTVIPTLIASLQRDPSATVRLKSVQALGGFKFVSQSAGLAMEMALQSDPDASVRDALKNALWEYHLNGYRTVGAANKKPSESDEPPLATVAPKNEPPLATTKPTPTNTVTTFRPITNTVGKGTFYQPTPEPPLASPAPAVPLTPKASPAPLPVTSPNTTPAPLPTVPMPLPSPVPVATPTIPQPMPQITFPVPKK
jgi:hypothetical protein